MVTFQVGERGEIINVQLLELAQPLGVMFPSSEYLTRAGWTPQGDQYVFRLLSRHFELYFKQSFLSKVFGFNWLIEHNRSWTWFLFLFTSSARPVIFYGGLTPRRTALTCQALRSCAAFTVRIGSM